MVPVHVASQREEKGIPHVEGDAYPMSNAPTRKKDR
jgi:hypothetical protein